MSEDLSKEEVDLIVNEIVSEVRSAKLKNDEAAQTLFILAEKLKQAAGQLAHAEKLATQATEH